MATVKIGLIGFGTIGEGVYELLKSNGKMIKEKTGLDLEIKKICDIRLDYLKSKVSNIDTTDKWEEIINDDEIETVIELIGGTEPAKTIVLQSLKKGKNLIATAKRSGSKKRSSSVRRSNRSLAT